MEGIVRQVYWIFPHVTIYVEIENEQGQAQMWAMGASTPPGVEEAGVSKDHVQPGDRVGVRCYPIKDGSLAARWVLSRRCTATWRAGTASSEPGIELPAGRNLHIDAVLSETMRSFQERVAGLWAEQSSSELRPSSQGEPINAKNLLFSNSYMDPVVLGPSFAQWIECKRSL